MRDIDRFDPLPLALGAKVEPARETTEADLKAEEVKWFQSVNHDPLSLWVPSCFEVIEGAKVSATAVPDSGAFVALTELKRRDVLALWNKPAAEWTDSESACWQAFWSHQG